MTTLLSFYLNNELTIVHRLWSIVTNWLSKLVSIATTSHLFHKLLTYTSPVSALHRQSLEITRRTADWCQEPFQARAKQPISSMRYSNTSAISWLLDFDHLSRSITNHANNLPLTEWFLGLVQVFSLLAVVPPWYMGVCLDALRTYPLGSNDDQSMWNIQQQSPPWGGSYS